MKAPISAARGRRAFHADGPAMRKNILRMKTCGVVKLISMFCVQIYCRVIKNPHTISHIFKVLNYKQLKAHIKTLPCTSLVYIFVALSN